MQRHTRTLPIVGEGFAGQYRVKLKCARPIAGNSLTAGTKLNFEQIFKTFEERIRPFHPSLDNGEQVHLLEHELKMSIVGVYKNESPSHWKSSNPDMNKMET
jgi:hypothetical protein